MATRSAKARRIASYLPYLLAGLILMTFPAAVLAQESHDSQEMPEGQENTALPENQGEVLPEEAPGGITEFEFSDLEQAVDERLSLQGTGVVLQGLDKITARVSTFSVPLDELAVFGSLQITVRACFKTPPEEAPENAAFLEIIEQKPDSEARKVFGGWMFSSSPAVSALEHPVYDVWVHNCILPGDTDFEYSSGDEVGEPGGEGETPEGDAGG